jgi:hypothetical protein
MSPKLKPKYTELELEEYINAIFNYDFKPEQARFTKQAMLLLNDKDASIESMNKLRGSIITLSNLAYDKWFYSMPLDTQEAILKLEKSQRFDINTSRHIGEGQTTPESLEIVTPNKYVLEFYEQNPAMQKLDDLSGRLLTKMYEIQDKNSGV